MAYPKQFARLSYLFGIEGTDEIADTSLHISTVGTSPFVAADFVGDATTAELDDLAEGMQTMLATTGLFHASYSAITGMKLAPIGVDGLYTNSPLVEPFSETGGTFESVPPQVALVLSLRSGLTFGRANFGRMYLPHVQPRLANGTPYISPSDADAWAAAAKTMLDAVNTWADGILAGAGIVNISKVGAGTVKAVANVQVGLLSDTQRRRRNRLSELPYSVEALA